MRHFTLAELATPEGAREFMDECEKPENSVPQTIVCKLRRAIDSGTDWHDNELSDIVQTEIEDILSERAELIDALELIAGGEFANNVTHAEQVSALREVARAAIAKAMGQAEEKGKE